MRWDGPGEVVDGQGKIPERGEVSELRRESAGEAIDFEVQNSEAAREKGGNMVMEGILGKVK